MLKRHAGLAAALLIIRLLTGGQASAACRLAKIADLPVTMVGTRPVTTIKINGQDAPIVTDSGAFYSTLSAAAAAQYNLTLRYAPIGLYVKGVGGESRTLQIGEAKSVTIAGVVIPHISFLVQENDFGGGTVGVMGQNILGLRDVEFDLANGMIRLFSREDCGSGYFAYWDKDGRGSTVEIQREPTPNRMAILTQTAVTEVLVNGVKLRAAWDTGAESSVITLRAAKRAGIDVGGADVRAMPAEHGFGSRLVKAWIAPIQSFKVGDEEIKNTKIRIGDFGGDTFDMLLGADFFLSHRVYVANTLNRLFFTYNGGAVFRLTAPPAAEMAVAAEPPAKDGDPVDADGYSRRGAAYAGRKDYPHALADLDKAIGLAPTEPSYYYERASVFLQNRQQFLSMADLDKAVALKPDYVDALMSRAALKLAGHDKAGAQTDLDAAAGFAPKEANARMAMGELYGRLNLYGSAIAQYDLWLRFHGEDVVRGAALNGRCYAKAVLNVDLDHALGDCNAAIHVLPGNAAVLASRALVRLRRGELDQAITDYDVALVIRPTLAFALYGRGVAKVRKGLVPEGETDISAAQALTPDIAEIAKARGLAP